MPGRAAVVQKTRLDNRTNAAVTCLIEVCSQVTSQRTSSVIALAVQHKAQGYSAWWLRNCAVYT